MFLKTPQFWHKKNSLLSILLIPFSWLYRIGHALNMRRQSPPYKASIPVICIGNAIAGGSGKTPSVIALIKIIKDNNIAKNPYILTRGYGAEMTAPTLVDLSKHRFHDVGDEALLLAQHAPTIISPNRAAGAKYAEEQGADLIIMDDGLQNNHVKKTLSFLVIDRQIDFGNNRILPAGPLREPLSTALMKVQAIICIGRPFHSDKDVFEASIKPHNIPDTSQDYIAFAGLGYPEKFKNTLLDLKMNLVGWYGFPDHHVYSPQDINNLKQETKNKNVKLITTEKDFVRLSENQKEDILTLPIHLNFKNADDISAFIKNKLEDGV